MATEQALVNVMYVGQKPHAIDNVSGSGVTWQGRGDVQPVPADKAKMLFSHPDQWWPEGPVPTVDAVAQRVRQFFSGKGIPEGVVTAKALEEMNEAELAEYLFREYGERARPGLTRAQLLEEIDAFELAAQEQGGAAATVAKPRPRARAKAPSAAPSESAAKPLPALDVKKAGKDRLEQYARTHLGVELDQRKSLAKLRAQVKGLIKKHKAAQK